MCDYCGCHDFPLIRRFADEHLVIEETAGALRRAIMSGDTATAVPLRERLRGLLLPHTEAEERGLFAELRDEGSLAGAVSALCAEHADLHAALASPDRTTVLPALDRLHRHIDNEEHGLFPAAVIALPIDAWDRITTADPAGTGRLVAGHSSV